MKIFLSAIPTIELTFSRTDKIKHRSIELEIILPIFFLF